MQGIIPPYLLEALAENGTPSQRAAALKTLESDARTRLERAAVAAARVQPVAAVGPPPHKNRTVYAAGTTLVRREGQGSTSDVAVDEAYDGLGVTFDLYWEIYNRDSLDGYGRDLIAWVHDASKPNNAQWTGSQVLFGDGDGETFRRFTLDVDVIGHELTHGVIDWRLVHKDRAAP